MWQDILNEIVEVTKKTGNAFWPGIEPEEEGEMMRTACRSAIADEKITTREIEQFLAHVLEISAPAASAVSIDMLNDQSSSLSALTMELIIIDEKLTPYFLRFFGRRLIPEGQRSSLTECLHGDLCAVPSGNLEDDIHALVPV